MRPFIRKSLLIALLATLALPLKGIAGPGGNQKPASSNDFIAIENAIQAVGEINSSVSQMSPTSNDRCSNVESNVSQSIEDCINKTLKDDLELNPSNCKPTFFKENAIDYLKLLEEIELWKNRIGNDTKMNDYLKVIEALKPTLKIRAKRKVQFVNTILICDISGKLYAVAEIPAKKLESELDILSLLGYPWRKERKGGGRAAIMTLMKEAYKQGYEGIKLESMKSAVEFYEKMGFTKTSLENSASDNQGESLTHMKINSDQIKNLLFRHCFN